MLDHSIVSELQRPITYYDIVDVNVDYPRVEVSVASDHELSVVWLNFNKLWDLEEEWADDIKKPGRL